MKSAILNKSAPRSSQSMDFILSDVKDVPISAKQLAGLADVSVNDVLYWTRSGFLGQESHQEGEGAPSNGDLRSYTFSELPKAQAMGVLAKKLGMKASRASEMADELLEEFADRPEAFAAAMKLVRSLDRKFADLVDLIMRKGLVGDIGALLKDDP